MTTKVVMRLDEKIKHYLAMGNGAVLRRLFARHNFADIAEVMENNLTEEEMLGCFQFLKVGQAAQILTSLSREKQIFCLSNLPSSTSSEILHFMPSDDAVDLLQELDTSQRQKILERMPFDTETRTIHHLMMEAPDSAAGIMSTDYISAPAESTVGEALSLIKQAEEKDFIYYCYLLDTHGALVGVVSLKQMILVPESTPLQQVATFDIKSIQAKDDQEEAANLFRKYYNLLALPVVDEEDILRGIITVDDVIDIIDEETSEDIYRASGISLEQIDEKNLLSGPVVNAVKARMPWLLVTMFGQFFAASIIASFHHTITAAVIAISFMPLLSGLSGNMGTQSETITVRGLALNLINDENIREKFFREIKVGIITGVLFAVGVGFLSYLQYRHWELSLLLFLAIIFSLCLSAILGLLMPYGFEKYFKQDPAGVGGPLITTLLDILTFSSYLFVLSLFLDRMI